MLLLGVLVALALGLALLVAAGAGMSRGDQRQRDAEDDLLSIGEQYRQAIDAYSRAVPGVRQWPTKLEDLVNDTRFPKPRHHLRKLFRDPIAPDRDWGIVYLGLSITGVYSQADGVPFRLTGFGPGQDGFANAGSYRDWQFVVSTASNAAAGGNSPYTELPRVVPRVPGAR